MKLSYPVSPVHVNQPFGGNPDYYARFGTKGHMGIDFQATHGQPVYAAHDGFAFYVGPDAHGGDGVYNRSETPEADGTYFTTINWHLCPQGDPQYAPAVGNPGRHVKKGEVLGYADNTGAPFESSGDHLHFGLAPCDQNGGFLQKDNGFGGCIDPQPFFVSEDLQIVQQEVQVLNQTTDSSVKQSLLALIVQQIKHYFGWG